MNIDPKTIEFSKKVIASEVRALRVRGVIRLSEEEDIAGELMLQLLDAWGGFDPRRGPIEAFINQVVNTRLISILRKRSAQKRTATVESLDASDDRVVDQASLDDGVGRLLDIKVDLKVALCNLTPKQREICDLLLRDAVTPVARELGMPRSTLRDAIVKIREVFQDAGLEEYL